MRMKREPPRLLFSVASAGFLLEVRKRLVCAACGESVTDNWRE